MASALHRSKDPLKKRLKEQAKIARWDEQTYYALAEAADRSHRHLFKMLRQYDQVLEEPVSSILVSAADGGAGGKSGGGADASDGHGSSVASTTPSAHISWTNSSAKFASLQHTTESSLAVLPTKVSSDVSRVQLM